MKSLLAAIEIPKRLNLFAELPLGVRNGDEDRRADGRRRRGRRHMPRSDEESAHPSQAIDSGLLVVRDLGVQDALWPRAFETMRRSRTFAANRSVRMLPPGFPTFRRQHSNRLLRCVNCFLRDSRVGVRAINRLELMALLLGGPSDSKL